MKNLIKLLTIVSTLLVIHTQASAGKWGTGGGDSEAASVQIDELRSYIIDVQKDLPIISNTLYLTFKNVPPNEKMKGVISSINNKLFSDNQLKNILQKYKPNIEMKKACHNKDMAQKEGSTVNTPSGTYCISPFWMLNNKDSHKYNRLSYKGLIVGLILHELSHFLDTTEEEALIVNQLATEAIGTLNLTPDWRNKMKNLVNYSIDYINLTADDLETNNSQLCSSISRFQMYLQSAGQQQVIVGLGYKSFSHFQTFLVQSLSLGYCKPQEKYQASFDYLGNKSLYPLAIATDSDDSDLMKELENPMYFLLLTFPKDRIALTLGLKILSIHLNKFIDTLNSNYDFKLEKLNNKYINSIDLANAPVDFTILPKKIKDHFERRKAIDIDHEVSFRLIKDIKILDSNNKDSLYFSNGKLVSYSDLFFDGTIEYCRISKSYMEVRHYSNKIISITIENNPYTTSYIDPGNILFLNSSISRKHNLAISCDTVTDRNQSNYGLIITRKLLKKHLKGVLEIIE